MDTLMMEMYKDVKKLMERVMELERENAILRESPISSEKKVENHENHVNDTEYDMKAMAFENETIIPKTDDKVIVLSEEKTRKDYQREYQREYRNKKKQEKNL
jgi:hypothetical protein